MPTMHRFSLSHDIRFYFELGPQSASRMPVPERRLRLLPKSSVKAIVDRR